MRALCGRSSQLDTYVIEYGFAVASKAKEKQKWSDHASWEQKIGFMEYTLGPRSNVQKK